MQRELEIRTMQNCARQIDKLEPPARKRVSTYLAEAYKDPGQSLIDADEAFGPVQSTEKDEPAKDAGIEGQPVPQNGATVERHG